MKTLALSFKLCSLTLLLLFAACAPSDPWSSENPEYALGAFLNALNFNDLETVWEYLGPRTKGQIRELSRQARQHEPDSTETHDDYRLLSHVVRVWSPSTAEVDRLQTLEHNADSALLSIHSIFGHQTSVEMLRIEGRWIIEWSDDNHTAQPSR